MTQFFFLLKQQVNTLSVLMLFLIIAFIAKRYQKPKLATVFFSLSAFIFLITSTAYLPRYLAVNLEKQYPAFSESFIADKSETVFIHVLGSGYSLDEKLPANLKLGPAAQGRLNEAIRIHHLYPNSVIVGSGNSILGLQTQAEVTQQAAMLLGVDSSKTAALTTPATTKEEARDLKKKYGEKIKLVIVTNAIHMPRAMKLFAEQGFNPIAAPVNFKVPDGAKTVKLKWWPSITNMGLTDQVLHEYLGSIKAKL